MLHFICIDKRTVDTNTGQVNVILENGKQILLPPNIHRVPALMLPKENYRIIYGNEIMSRFASFIKTQMTEATDGEGEPLGYSLSSGDFVVSEKYTMYNASVNDLSAKGLGGSRQLYHYVPASGTLESIKTPPDTYRPNKISQNITVDSIVQKRNEDVKTVPPSFIPSI